MHRFRLAFISFVLLAPLFTLVPGAEASGRQNGHEKNRHEEKGPKAGMDHSAARPKGNDNAWRGHHNAWQDRDHCVVVVHDYYDRRGLPPGLAKKHALPPGLQRQLYERGHLPPGLEKHWVMLPEPLERELPPLPPHHVRRIVGGDLLVVDLHLNVVVSLWRGVL